LDGERKAPHSVGCTNQVLWSGETIQLVLRRISQSGRWVARRRVIRPENATLLVNRTRSAGPRTSAARGAVGSGSRACTGRTILVPVVDDGTDPRIRDTFAWLVESLRHVITPVCDCASHPTLFPSGLSKRITRDLLAGEGKPFPVGSLTEVRNVEF
jgi:hypothetical protein